MEQSLTNTTELHWNLVFGETLLDLLNFIQGVFTLLLPRMLIEDFGEAAVLLLRPLAIKHRHARLLVHWVPLLIVNCSKPESFHFF